MPAAAVIPAPIAYIKVVAVKKLVVEILERLLADYRQLAIFFILLLTLCTSCWSRAQIFYLEKIRVFQAG